MKILQRYFLSQILKSVLFVLFAFLALFAFFDLIGELSSVGRGGYQLQHVLIYILLGIPGYIYELMPFAVLIGTIYALAMFASNSEYTIMRVSSLSTLDACWMLAKVGLVFLVFTFLVGEVITPVSARVATEFRNNLIGRAVGETMAVIMVAGNQPRLVGNLFKGIRTLTGNIVMEMGYATGLHREALIATGVVLFVFILIINFSVALLKRRTDHE